MRGIHAAPLSLALLASLGPVGMGTRSSAFAQTTAPVVTIDESIAALQGGVTSSSAGSWPGSFAVIR